MTRHRILAALLSVAASALPAVADEMTVDRPIAAASLHDGPLDMVAYYLPAADGGLDVTATFAAREDGARLMRVVMRLDEACFPVEVAAGVPGEGRCPRGGGNAGDRQRLHALFMGYMIGNALGRSSAGGYAGRPIYTDAKGGLFGSDGRQMGFVGPGSTVRGTPAAVRAPALNAPAAQMTRATISARGGFGAARTASFGG